ncbi:MAG: response regulator [Deltaproteobacteria bacterium]|nr:response regulator [Deltaproteobacteria bacterium]
MLVVEDNPVMLRFLQLTLESDGYRVLAVSDARSALELLRKDAPDVVLQDLILPDSFGFSLMAELQASPHTAAVPAIAISGVKPRLQDAWSGGVGFAAYLQKPVSPEVLLQTVEFVLRRAQVDEAVIGLSRSCLVVDHDETQRERLRDRLVAMGFSVVTAPSASGALAELSTRDISLIVSAVFMPGGNGFSLCSAARALERSASTTIVLVATVAGTDKDRERAEEAGADALIMGTETYWGLERAVRYLLSQQPG